MTRTFPPDLAAVGQLVFELAGELSQRGWRVGIATSTPGEVELPPQVSVARVPAAIGFTRKRLAQRLASYLAQYPALRRAAHQLGGPWDVVVSTTDPPLQAVLGPGLRRRTGGALVHWCQDIYPELAEELGVLGRGGFVARVLRRISTRSLQACDGIVSLGRCMSERLVARGLDPARLHLVPNWADHTNVHPLPRGASPLRSELGFAAGDFVVMYSGNFGLAHPFEAILEAAVSLAGDRRIRFLLAGDGPRAATVREGVARRALPNVTFLPLQPRARLAESLGAADLHLVSMFDRLCGLVVPSKYYGVMAAGRPVAFLGPRGSEVARSLEECQAGVALDESDARGLVDAIRRLAEQPDAWSKTAEAATQAGRVFDLPTCAEKLTRAWEHSLANRRTSG
ncbi:MAG: glycosyltransferase family 4 protein [Verrucomicrobia bacterium]|nr:glycosyltransferase family 4 protein [Verrucomicrobiota bacterium]